MSGTFDLQQGDLADLENNVLLVSASAGTGKTWTITHLATRWLLTDPDADPAALLMVTFSRLAAAELKARLRARVVEVGQYLTLEKAPPASDRWAIELMALPEVERSLLLDRQRWVLSRLDDVNARTIHSFAAVVHGDQGGRTTDGREIDERAVNETLTSWALNEPDALNVLIPDPLDDDAAMDEKAPSATKLQTSLVELLGSATALGGFEEGIDEGRSMAIADTSASDEVGERKAKVLRELVVEAERRAGVLRRLESTSTFNSMMSSVYWSIVDGGQSAIDRLRSAFSFVLIDEFQDTDLAQWRIFSTVFIGHVPLVIVGDPKQAIYGFRGGDVVIFQDLLRKAEQDPTHYRHASITNNFRSGPRLLGCLNALFMAAEAPAMQEHFASVPTVKKLNGGLARRWGFSSPLDAEAMEVAPITYEPVGCGSDDLSVPAGSFIIRDVSSVIERPSLGDARHLGSPPGSMKAKKAVPKTTVTRDDILDDVIEFLVERATQPAPDGSPFSWNDVLILTRSNGMAQAVRDHLHRHAIPAITTKTESVWRSPAAAQVRTMLHVLADPLNPRTVGLLHFTWFAHHKIDELPELAESMASDGPAVVARRLLDVPTTAMVLATPRPERNWTDLDHILDLVVEHFRHGIEPAAVLSWLEDQIEAARDGAEDDAVTRRIESDGDAISIMTMHAAKGLERAIVLIPEIEGSPGSKKMSGKVQAISTPEGRRYEFAPMAGGDAATDRAVDLALQATDESARLIYVGLTRAKSELVVWLSDRDRHEYSSAADAKVATFVRKTSLWRLLVESYLLTSPGEWAAIAASCDAGVPVERAITFHDRQASLLDARRELTESPTKPISKDGVEDPPEIPAPFRRWSYSALDVHGVSPAVAVLDDEDEETSAYDAGVLAEDGDEIIVDEETTTTTRLGANLFGRLAGNVVGTAIHTALEDLVGVVPSSDAGAVGARVEQAYAALALPLADPSRVTREFQAVLAHDLGETLGGSLDDLVGSDGLRVAKEMRFTLPLVASEDDEDRLLRLGDFVAAHDPEGPYVEFFAGLAHVRPHPRRLRQGFLTGSIDLVAQRTDGRFVVVDYKSNLLKEATSYRSADLVGEMATSGYPLQGLLYTVALHRFLSGRLEGYDPATHLAGIAYYYVRAAALGGAKPGDGVAAWDIPAHVVRGVSAILANEEPV